MVKIKIDEIELVVPEGTSVMKAAESAGIEIPSMCFMEPYSNHPSCMICLVKDKKSGDLFPSCAIPAAEGMDLLSNDDDVKKARKDALELLLSDHVGDCEAPCRNGCPAFMDIPLMNRLIVSGDYDKSIQVVKEHIAIPLILGYICPAPCEKVCRRVPINEAVSICQLKKFVSDLDLQKKKPYFPEKAASRGKKLVIIGAGPAGLSAAYYLTQFGHDCTIIDENEMAGGSLLQLPETLLPKEALVSEINMLEQFGVKFNMQIKLQKNQLVEQIIGKYDAVIIASGHKGLGVEDFAICFENAETQINKDTYETGLPGVFVCGSIIRELDMAVKAVAQGRSAALSVDQYLNGLNPKKEHKKFNSKFGKLLIDEHKEYLKESLEADRQIPKNGDLSPFDTEEATLEATRCMHCDCRKPKTCKLRIYSDEYGADRRKYLTSDRKTIEKHFNHEQIIYEPEKCIKCGLCVEITVKNKELTGLAFVGRGFDVKIKAPFDKSMEDALTNTAIKCAEACPTGAISIKEKIK